MGYRDEDRRVAENVASVLAQFEGLDSGGTHRIDRPTEESYTATTDRIVVPDPSPTVEALDAAERHQPTDALRLPSGAFLLTARVGGASDASRVVVRFEGPASVRPTGEQTRVALTAEQAVTVGIHSETDGEPERVVVPKTPSGIAAGLSAFRAAHRTASPSRSHPDRRQHPPLLAFGEAVSVPRAVRAQQGPTDIELQVPAALDELFVVAPLAFYLGADLTVGERDSVLLTAAGTTVTHEFGRLPQLQEEVADVLRRVFYLDCLCRTDPATARGDRLGELGIDAATVRGLSPAGRLERYLDVTADGFDTELPEWHLSTHVRPSIERVPSLPYLLDKLSLVCIADQTETRPRDLLDRTLTDAYPTRGTETKPPGMVTPPLGPGGTHAWLAPGTPLDAFKTTPEAFEHRFSRRERGRAGVRVAVVRNADEMADEHGTVAATYRDAALPTTVTVEEGLTTHELATLFESESDFVHFVGHCDEAGLRCPDGNLAVADLTDLRTTTFFLNACGSYDQGLALVERGAVAGGVTVTDVLDDHAVRVGTAFAKLLSHGFCLQRALELARRRIMMGKDYTVVGDGTYALGSDESYPTVVWLTESGDGFELTCEVATPRSAGVSYPLPFDDEWALNGTRRTFSFDAETVRETLADASVPVVYDGDLLWSDDVESVLGGPR